MTGQRNPPYKQDHVLLFTVNKDNWPIRESIFVSRDHHNAKWTFTSQDHHKQNLSHPSSMVLIFSKY